MYLIFLGLVLSRKKLPSMISSKVLVICDWDHCWWARFPSASGCPSRQPMLSPRSAHTYSAHIRDTSERAEICTPHAPGHQHCIPAGIRVSHPAVWPPELSKGQLFGNTFWTLKTPPMGLKISHDVLQGTSNKRQKELVCHTQTFDLLRSSKVT